MAKLHRIQRGGEMVHKIPTAPLESGEVVSEAQHVGHLRSIMQQQGPVASPMVDQFQVSGSKEGASFSRSPRGKHGFRVRGSVVVDFERTLSGHPTVGRLLICRLSLSLSLSPVSPRNTTSTWTDFPWDRVSWPGAFQQAG